jgi:putative flippase GtrA
MQAQFAHDPDTLADVSNIQKRGSYTPRRVREQRAYRLILVGGSAGVVGIVGLVLAAAGAIEATLPIVALIVAAVCAVVFRSMTTRR